MVAAMPAYDFSGKTVVLTGASMGIGAAFARALAPRGAQLVLVARSRDRLDALARELGPARARVVVEDLIAPGAAARVAAAVGEADVLINNAGFGAHGAFAAQPLESQRDQVELNVRAVVELSHAFLPGIERRRGGVIHVASTAAFQPVPYMAVYGATKAFVLSFSEALWAEYRGRGVRITAVCPGATETPFFERAGQSAAVGKKASPEAVVEVALRAFDRNRPSVIHGVANYLTAQSPRWFPRGVVARISARVMRPRRQLAAGAAQSGTRSA